MRKRFLSALLVLCLILSLLPGMPQAAYITSGSCGENATWSFDEKTGTLTVSGSGRMDDYHEISSPWNYYMYDMQSVVISEGITSLGNYAFAGAYRLTGVSLPGTLESIGDRTFEDCGALSSVTIPQNLKTIGQKAFFMCHKLESIELPASVTDIGECAFYSVALTGIWVDPENAFYSNDERGVLFNKAKTRLIHAPSALQGEYSIPESVTAIENFAFMACGITAVTIPQGVTTVGYGAFEYCEELSQIRFPASVNSIGQYALRYCKGLTGIWVDEANTVYHSDSQGVLFEGAALLQAPLGLSGAYEVPEGTEIIKAYAFEYCGLTRVKIPTSVEALEDGSFSQCHNLMSVEMAEGVSIIGSQVFSACESLIKIKIPASVKELGQYLFYKSAVAKIQFTGDAPTAGAASLSDITATAYYPEGNPTWTKGVMQSYLGDITWIPYEEGTDPLYAAAHGTCGENATWSFEGETGVLTISGTGAMENYAYYDPVAPWSYLQKEILSVVIEDGITHIGAYAFSDCLRVKRVQLPNSLTGIEDSAFLYCTYLADINIPESLNYIGISAFSYCSRLDNIVIPGSVTYIRERTFSYCVGLTNITLCEGLSGIGEEAFDNCFSLPGIIIPEGVCSIAGSAFRDCESLVAVTLPESLTKIGGSAFAHCTQLVDIIIPENVTDIGGFAFGYCASLTEIAIPESVIHIGGKVFGYCPSLTGILVDENNPNYSSDSYGVLFNKDKTRLMQAPGAFSGVYLIPEGVACIEGYAFCGCAKLTGIIIPEGVTYIKDGAFADCTGLYGIKFAGNAPTIEDYAFRKVIATAYYPRGNETWGYRQKQSFGGKITWVSYAEGTDPFMPFEDVGSSKYYYLPVIWALENGITTGATPTTFAPNKDCTRGQIVTFLWRAAGEPEPAATNNPFTDVEEDDFYYKAVLWAVEEGITNGASATTFNPKGSCTRAQVVTFMWRAAGEPTPTSANNPFTDVPEGKYYHDAVLWAVEQEITNGTSPTKFSPNNICNRGQIVTFLYRGYAD